MTIRSVTVYHLMRSRNNRPLTCMICGHITTVIQTLEWDTRCRYKISLAENGYHRLTIVSLWWISTPSLNTLLILFRSDAYTETSLYIRHIYATKIKLSLLIIRTVYWSASITWSYNACIQFHSAAAITFLAWTRLFVSSKAEIRLILKPYYFDLY